MTTNLTPPKWRQHIMRVLFLLILVGLGPDHWVAVFSPSQVPDPMSGVTISFYAAFAFLCLLGIRFPLKFIPLLLIQLVYKSAWVIGTYLPAKNAGLLDDNYESWFWSMAPGIVIDLLVIPWGYVYQEYLKDFFVWKKVAA
ncbi:hypothetical protein [Reichenbachiella sp.]|uniref:hypothetical protein n=1 Tax=Reichenbachiella sp. TaxID=2184521 RepID=UPI003B59B640